MKILTHTSVCRRSDTLWTRARKPASVRPNEMLSHTASPHMPLLMKRTITCGSLPAWAGSVPDSPQIHKSSPLCWSPSSQCFWSAGVNSARHSHEICYPYPHSHPAPGLGFGGTPCPHDLRAGWGTRSRSHSCSSSCPPCPNFQRPQSSTTASRHGQQVGLLLRGLRAGDWPAGALWTLTWAAQAPHQKQGHCAKRGGTEKERCQTFREKAGKWNMRRLTDLTKITQGTCNRTGGNACFPQPRCDTLPPSEGATSTHSGRHRMVTWRTAMAAFLIFRSSAYSAGNHHNLQSPCVLMISVPYSKISSKTHWHKQSTFYMALSKLDIEHNKSNHHVVTWKLMCMFKRHIMLYWEILGG